VVIYFEINDDDSGDDGDDGNVRDDDVNNNDHGTMYFTIQYILFSTIIIT